MSEHVKDVDDKTTVLETSEMSPTWLLLQIILPESKVLFPFLMI